MRVHAVFNPAAGPDTPDPEQLAALLRDAGLEVTLACVDAPAMPAALQAAAAAPGDAVIVGGGDGTVGTAAGVLAGSDKPLAVLPLGTFNHFARDLGMPLDLAAAARVIAQGAVRRVDVAEVNGRVFINNSSVGIYPKIVEARREEERLRRRSRRAALAIATLRTLRTLPRLHLQLDAAAPRRCRTSLVFVGNNAYELSGWALGARRQLDGGRLSVYVAHHESALGLLRLFGQALLGRLHDDDAFEALETDRLTIHLRAPQVRVAVDGEVVVLPTPLRYRIRPGALRLLAPPLAAAGADAPAGPQPTPSCA